MNYETPTIGTTCPALTDENYEYELSGDAGKHCQCILNKKRCIAIHVVDPDDQSSQFFSRCKCQLDRDDLKDCPVYGGSKETIKLLAREKLQKDNDEKMNQIG